MPTIWALSPCWHVSAHVEMPTCADMCRYVPTCSITLGISDANHLDLICMLACVSTCGHADMCWYVPTCADMCQDVASFSAPLIPTIWTLPPCWHVSAHVDMPICAYMCQHVTSLSAPMIPIIWTWSAIQYVSAHVDMPTCANMCWHVPTYDIILGTSDTNHLDLCSMLACVSTCGHADMLPLMCADMSQHVASLSAPLIPIIGNLSVCKMSIYPVRFTYLLDRFKTRRFKTYSWKDKFQEHFPKYKYKDTVTYYLMNCLLQDITLWLGIVNQFHSLDVILIPVS